MNFQVKIGLHLDVCALKSHSSFKDSLINPSPICSLVFLIFVAIFLNIFQFFWSLSLKRRHILRLDRWKKSQQKFKKISSRLFICRTHSYFCWLLSSISSVEELYFETLFSFSCYFYFISFWIDRQESRNHDFLIIKTWDTEKTSTVW